MTTTSSTSSSTTAATTAITSATTSAAAADPAALGSALATAIGGGTGIDMTQLATNISNAQFLTQTQQLSNQQTKVVLQISQASQLKSDLLNLTQSLGSAIDSGNLVPAPTVTNGTVASASLPFGSSGASGSYSLEVTALAKPQVLTSASYGSAASTTGSGTLSIHFGTIAGSGFTEDTGHAAVDITIPAGATLADVASAINGAGAGVSAYIATDSNGARLVMKQMAFRCPPPRMPRSQVWHRWHGYPPPAMRRARRRARATPPTSWTASAAAAPATPLPMPPPACRSS